MTDRKYALTKIKAGDYLLPSNSGKALWRLLRYEDGPSHGLDWPRDRQVWSAYRYRKPIDTDDMAAIAADLLDDIDDWDMWILNAQSLDTRSEAIETALTYTEGNQSDGS